MRRREFLISSAGSAATLLTFDPVHAAAGARGGQSEIPKEAALDNQVAKAALGGNEFIFDDQNHCVDPKTKFRSHPDPAVAELEDFFDRPGAYQGCASRQRHHCRDRVCSLWSRGGEPKSAIVRGGGSRIGANDRPEKQADAHAWNRVASRPEGERDRVYGDAGQRVWDKCVEAVSAVGTWRHRLLLG